MTTASTPDPAHGLFETLLVLDGEPVALAAHLDRLAASLTALFGATLPAGLAADAAARAQGIELGRMRIVVDSAGAGATLTAQEIDPADFFPDRDRGAELRSLPCPGGLAAHKWADRRFLGEVRGEPVPLLFDGDELLEAGRANVFAVCGSLLRTPALDGRILPGTARAATIAIAREEGIEVREEGLHRADLFAADEVFLTGSVRGVEPARALDGAPLAAAPELSRLVGDRLRRRWLGASIGSAPPVPVGAPPRDPLVR